jgi:2-methylcitrate dehydratase PrpD
MDTCFKRFATGGANQGSAAVALALRERHHIDHARICRVRVGIPLKGSHERMNYAGIPYRGPFHTIDQCLISKPFAIAAVIINGNMTFDTVCKLQRAPALNALTAKIELKEVAGIDGWDLRMEIELDDGTVLRGDGNDIDRRHLYLGWDLATEKFRSLAAGKLGARRAEEIIALVGGLEKLASVEPITARLVPAAPGRARKAKRKA